MKRKFIAAGLGILTIISVSFSVVKLRHNQALERTVNYAQIETWQHDSREDFFNWESIIEQINSLPLFRYTIGITLIFFLIFVFAIYREKELNPITMRPERIHPAIYLNNLLSSVAKKEPWEIFEKIFLPVFIGLIASFITYDLEQIQEQIADKRLHEQIWENYLKEIREILVDRPNINNTDTDTFDYLDLIRANTLAVSIRLEDNRILKGLLLQFLYDTELIRCRELDADCNRIVSLDGVNLENAQLMNANLENAKLSGTNFTNVKLTNSTLVEADLSYAKLVGAELRNANLNQANLSFATLNNADLRGADLSQANLTNANLSGAKMDKKTTLLFATLCQTIMPDGKMTNSENCP
ncbi:MAG: pentapeptide repeat-containing protein [Cyanobacteriota bacterium]|nr:pentapeptide repeat-containing protein [Cyanobacteriota bacterium]